MKPKYLLFLKKITLWRVLEHRYHPFVIVFNNIRVRRHQFGFLAN